ncbi:MAG TPA: hypothetical protein VEY30_00470, partial [Myxococcaceae bacterium]|nr:hypothetical protein [Myxococcaceae bacterium]
ETVDRVGSRVQGWAEDTLAQARAQKGLAHPYLANLRETFKEQLGVPNGPTPRDLGVGSAVKEMARNYRTAVQAFGRNGTPDLPPPGHAPTQSEVLAELYRDDPNGALPLRMLVAAEELAHALRGSRPLLSLTLELRQDRRGAILGAAVTESSGNPHFDAFVLAVGRTAPQALPEPPADAFRSDVLRSIWQVEGWLRNSRNGPQAMKMVPGFMGASPELLMREINSGNARFDFRARLLKAY